MKFATTHGIQALYTQQKCVSVYVNLRDSEIYGYCASGMIFLS